MGDVYSIRNVINGRIYIGATTKNYLKRWKDHLSDAHKETYSKRDLYKDILKYGKEAFELSLIYSTDIKDELFKKEKELITQLKKNGINLYNTSLGGKGRSNVVASEQEVISYYLFLSNFNTAETARFFHIDSGTVKKMLYKYHIRPLTIDENNRKYGLKIAQYDISTHKLICSYDSIADAAYCMTKNRRNSAAIRHCLKGRSQTAFGYCWEYLDLPKDTKAT